MRIVFAIALSAAPLFLAGGLIWAVRSGGTVSKPRRKLFVLGVASSSLAYAVHFVLRWYMGQSRLGYWDQVDVVVGVGGLMFLAAMVGLIGGGFGRGYGRVAACLGSLLVCAMWWMTGVSKM